MEPEGCTHCTMPYVTIAVKRGGGRNRVLSFRIYDVIKTILLLKSQTYDGFEVPAYLYCTVPVLYMHCVYKVFIAKFWSINKTDIESTLYFSTQQNKWVEQQLEEIWRPWCHCCRRRNVLLEHLSSYHRHTLWCAMGQKISRSASIQHRPMQNISNLPRTSTIRRIRIHHYVWDFRGKRQLQGEL